MLQTRSLTIAAAALAAALIILGAACGDDDDGGTTETPEATGGASESPGTAGTPVARTIDLGSAADIVALASEDATDLVNVGSTLSPGDFNGDGQLDALIGAPQADGPDNEREDAGEAYVIFGPLDAGRDLASADVKIYGAAAGDGLGSTVTTGDLNSDGTDDVLVGAPGVTAGFDPRSDQGRVYVFWGGDDIGDQPELDLTEDVFDVTVTGAEGFSRLGHAMDTGDVNGDGTEDLVVGAPFAGRVPGSAPGGERTALGEVYVVYGADDLSGERNIARDEFDVLLSGAIAFGQFGASVGVGDVNGDGTDDVVIGAYRASGDTNGGTTGVAYVFKGGAEFTGRKTAERGEQDTTIIGPPSSSFGFPLAVADLNGDGIDDMAFGAQLDSSGEAERAGAIHVVFGSDGLEGEHEAAEVTSVTIAGGITGGLFPSALSAPDIDGDDVAELAAGSALAGTDDRPGAGVVQVFTGLGATPETIDLSRDSAWVTVLGAARDDRLGAAVAGERGEDGAVFLLLATQADTSNDERNLGIVYVVPVAKE